jgi:hypothetical protein
MVGLPRQLVDKAPRGNPLIRSMVEVEVTVAQA